MTETQNTPAPAGDMVAEFPLSAAQTRCWIIDQAMPGNVILNVAVRWQLTGPLRSDDLEAAFHRVIDRHEVLRTSFHDTDAGPVQRVHETVPFQLATVDLRPVPEADQPARVDAIAREVAARPFDLSQPGLIRATLIRLTQDRAILCYVIHQSCFDGFSIKVLGREIGSALAGIDLPELELQYGDYTLWQKDYFDSGALDEDLAYWRDTLADAPYFEVPTDAPRPLRKDGVVHHVTTDLPDGFGDRLTRAAQTLGVSKFALGTAIFSAALHRVTGAEDVLFGTQIAGRMDEALEPLIGVFINNLVLRTRPTADTALAQHIARARPVVEGALIHQQAPFNKLVETLNPPRDPSRTPLISINFNLQSVFMETADYGGISMKSVPSHAPGALYDLDMAVMERPTGWQITLEYAAELFTEDSARQIVETVVNCFDAAFDAPETPLGQIPMSGPLRRAASERSEDRDRALALVENRLTAHPMVAEAVALSHDGGAYGFVVPGDTGAFPLEQLPEAILADLSESGLTGISVVAALPRSSTGTPNRSALRIPAGRKPAPADDGLTRETLTALRADWAELLDTHDVSSTAHFFDLGGHSLLVLRMIARLRDRWGVALDLAEVYENPVLGDFARIVTARRAPAMTGAPVSDPSLLRLRKEGTGQPFIAVNNAATALAISTLPGQDRPVSVVRLPEDRMDIGTQADFLDVAEMYAEQVRRLQAEGPYLLYGNCVHGNLALETARLLVADGAPARVMMKDVWEPGFSQQVHRDPRLRKQDRTHSLKLRLKYWREGEMSTAALLGSYGIFHRTGALRTLHALRLIDHAQKTDLEAGQEAFIIEMSRARDRYRPAPVAFPVLHIVTDASPSGPLWKPSLGWEDVVAEGQLQTVHFDRFYISRDRRIGVEDMGAAMERWLAEER